ncbi:MAG: LAGLIDADG family homing endonuclease [bacterium]|nr:LAGLIDADG family homing endonuclease [bacterium]
MRVKISKNERKKLFTAVIERYGGIKKFSDKTKINRRTLNDWQRGATTIPLEKFNKFVKILDFKVNDFLPQIIPDFWHIKEASRKGGLARFSKYGNIGTAEGRRRGGLTSIAIHKKNGTLFNNIKPIKKSSKSEKLAEFFGIMFGDGHLSNYQASVTTSSETDKEHALHTKKLIQELFNIKPSFKIRKQENVVIVVASSRNLVKFLNKNGMPIGNKIENKLTAPDWIKNNSLYRKAFIRGLFDTDGCVYLDTHRINKKTYKHLGLTITSYADNLILDIIDFLRSLGFSPTNRKTQKSVFLRRQQEIVRYFKEIGTNNPKHYNRYIKFIGEVPKWS